MKSQLREVDDHGTHYQALVFICPGCAAGGPERYEGLHMLPVNSPGLLKPSWDWDGNLERPTLSPSILTRGYSVCHSFLKAGVFNFLTDSTHPLSGKSIPISDLPEWAVKIN